ncbi:MAG: hypothetical protein MUF71_09940 [Candidatus Kapabacteria bacterium]|nr:hypothetical protein [Candidatus Kapabacteria bacterium]
MNINGEAKTTATPTTKISSLQNPQKSYLAPFCTVIGNEQLMTFVIVDDVLFIRSKGASHSASRLDFCVDFCTL